MRLKIRPATPQESLAQTVQDGIDELDELLCELRIQSADHTESATSSLDQSNRANETNTIDADFTTNEPNAAPTIGDRVSVFWPEDDIYYPGVIDSEAEDGRLNVTHDDGEQECVDMSKES